MKKIDKSDIKGLDSPGISQVTKIVIDKIYLGKRYVTIILEVDTGVIILIDSVH